MWLRMFIKMLIFVGLFAMHAILGAEPVEAAAYHSMVNPVEGELEVTSDFG